MSTQHSHCNPWTSKTHHRAPGSNVSKTLPWIVTPPPRWATYSNAWPLKQWIFFLLVCVEICISNLLAWGHFPASHCRQGRRDQPPPHYNLCQVVIEREKNLGHLYRHILTPLQSTKCNGSLYFPTEKQQRRKQPLVSGTVSALDRGRPQTPRCSVHERQLQRLMVSLRCLLAPDAPKPPSCPNSQGPGPATA